VKKKKVSQTFCGFMQKTGFRKKWIELVLKGIIFQSKFLVSEVLSHWKGNWNAYL